MPMRAQAHVEQTRIQQRADAVGQREQRVRARRIRDRPSAQSAASTSTFSTIVTPSARIATRTGPFVSWRA